MLVADAAIAEAQRALWDRCASRPSRAAPRPSRRCSRAATARARERVGVLLCGGNTTAVDFER